MKLVENRNSDAVRSDSARITDTNQAIQQLLKKVMTIP